MLPAVTLVSKYFLLPAVWVVTVRELLPTVTFRFPVDSVRPLTIEKPPPVTLPGLFLLLYYEYPQHIALSGKQTSDHETERWDFCVLFIEVFRGNLVALAATLASGNAT